jgi:hypothetical protein
MRFIVYFRLKGIKPQSKLWTLKTVQAPRNRVYELGEANYTFPSPPPSSSAVGRL